MAGCGSSPQRGDAEAGAHATSHSARTAARALAGHKFYIILMGMVDCNIAMAKTHNIEDMAKVRVLRVRRWLGPGAS